MAPFEIYTVRYGRYEWSVSQGGELSPQTIARAALHNHAFNDLWNEGKPEEGLKIYPVSRFDMHRESYETNDAEFLWWIPGSDCGAINNAGLWSSGGPAHTLHDALRLAFGGEDA